jgi:hypothetical protein
VRVAEEKITTSHLTVTSSTSPDTNMLFKRASANSVLVTAQPGRLESNATMSEIVYIMYAVPTPTGPIGVAPVGLAWTWETAQGRVESKFNVHIFRSKGIQILRPKGNVM